MSTTNNDTNLLSNSETTTNTTPTTIVTEIPNLKNPIVLCPVTNDIERPIHPLTTINNVLPSTMCDSSELDLTSYNVLEYINNHPQSPNTPVIHNINWNDLPDISNPETATIVAQFIFKPKAYWLNKSFLYDSVKMFASKTGFTPKYLHTSCIGCN